MLARKTCIKIGSLTPIRDFSYVKDTVDGFVKIALSERSIGELINVGFGAGITIGELAESIINLIGGKVDIISDNQRVRPKNSEVMELICSNGKAKKLIDWEPHYTLRDGISETVSFIKDNLNLYKTDIYNI